MSAAGPFADPLAPLRPFVLNPLPAVSALRVAGVLGDHPSLYSRSPAMWNAAFAALGLPAAYVPFDVEPGRVEAFLDSCRRVPGLLGLSVTVPYKERVLRALDALDPDAEAVGAVNTVLRTPDGHLRGGNTDSSAALHILSGLLAGPGAIDSGARQPDSSSQHAPRILVLGAGGAARAVGVGAARGFPGAEILLCARRRAQAEEAATAIRRAGGRAAVIDPAALAEVLPVASVVVNASPVGMVGPLMTPDGVTWLEPYSALAPAAPPVLAGDPGAAPPATWWEQAWPGIARNVEISLRRALQLHRGAAVLDLVYVPPETVLLKHARWTGHTAVNGLGLLVTQAVEAFLRLCGPILETEPTRARPRVEHAMTGALG